MAPAPLPTQSGGHPLHHPAKDSGTAGLWGQQARGVQDSVDRDNLGTWRGTY